MRHLVNVGKTNPNKPKVKIGKMNITSFITMNYEQITMNDANKNKAKQTQTNPISNVPKSPRFTKIPGNELETKGIEPSFPRCDRGVLPLHYVPNIDFKNFFQNASKTQRDS